jgi:GABA(A) receptor-associated protein
MEYIKEFYKTKPIDVQRQESDKLRAKHPDRIPVIVDRANNYTAKLDKNKYLVPTDLTVGQFLIIIRRRIKLSPEKALFFFTEDNVMPPVSQMMCELFKNKANEGKYLVITYSEENTFG